MLGRLQRVCHQVVIGVAEIIRDVEHEPHEKQQEYREAKRVLDRGIGREGHRVALDRLDLDARRIVLPADMQRPDMQHDDACDHEGQQIMQREEPVERRVADRIATPQPDRDGLANQRNGGEKVGDDGRAPERHLAPRQHVAHESGRHHQEKDDDAQNPQDLARIFVGTVIHAAQDVDVDGDKKHRCAIGVQIAHQPAEIHVAHDVFDRGEGIINMRRVMHAQHYAGDDLRHQHE